MLKIFRNKHIKESEEVELDKNNIPKHIAIIMDGNGRWAKQRNLPRTMGHKAGVETIKGVVEECDRLGVKYLTLYAFSTENWKRPQEEVNALMNLILEYIKNEFNELHKNGVILRTLGDLSKLPEKCQRELELTCEKTKNNSGVVLNIALNYGGRDEIINGIKNIIKDIENNEISADEINEELFSNYLYTKGMPDPDLIIRPSGEKRLSNFLLWQCAYSEFSYLNVNWPDFKPENLRKAIYEYQNRDRRFGGIK